MVATPQDPALVITYGPSGIGKTTENGYSFPRGIFAAAPGALKSIQSVVGYAPKSVNARTIQDLIKLIDLIKSGALVKAGVIKSVPDALVVDDFSYITEMTFHDLEARLTGHKLWGGLRELVMEFRDAARNAGLHVIVNAWEQAPHNNPKRGYVRGGPKLSADLPEQLPALFDTVLRCVPEPMRRPWPAAYHCELGTDYIMKDRHNVAPLCSPAPMNTAELLRAAGFVVGRLEEIAGQEEMVEKYSQELLAGSPDKDREKITAMMTNLIKGGMKPEWARWTLRDAIDRATIRRSMEARRDIFFF